METGSPKRTRSFNIEQYIEHPFCQKFNVGSHILGGIYATYSILSGRLDRSASMSPFKKICLLANGPVMLFCSGYGHWKKLWRVDYWGILTSVYGASLLALEKLYKRNLLPYRQLRTIQFVGFLYWLYLCYKVKHIKDGDTYNHQLVPFALCAWGVPFYFIVSSDVRGFKYAKLALYNTILGFFVYSIGTHESIPHNIWHLLAINSHLLFRQL